MDLLPILLVTLLLTIIAMGVIALFRLTERNSLQQSLIAILLIFFFLFSCLFINMICQYMNERPTAESILSFRTIVLGYIAFFSFISYYMVALHNERITTGNIFRFLSPVIFMLLIYMFCYVFTGESMSRNYANFRDLADDLWTIPVMLRLLMLFLYIPYVLFVCFDVYRYVSLMKQRNLMKRADVSNNIRWMVSVAIGIALITPCYFLFVFFKSPMTIIVYTSIMGMTILLCLDNAVSGKTYLPLSDYQMKWSLVGGFVLVEQNAQHSNLFEALTNWMKDEKPFCCNDFSLKNILHKFPTLESGSLNAFLEEQGENIQSYIRRYRIQEACRLIDKNPRMQASEIARQVGFMQQSSFSRAFNSVVGESPSQYIRRKKKNLSVLVSQEN